MLPLSIVNPKFNIYNNRCDFGYGDFNLHIFIASEMTMRNMHITSSIMIVYICHNPLDPHSFCNIIMKFDAKLYKKGINIDYKDQTRSAKKTEHSVTTNYLCIRI